MKYINPLYKFKNYQFYPSNMILGKHYYENTLWIQICDDQHSQAMASSTQWTMQHIYGHAMCIFKLINEISMVFPWLGIYMFIWIKLLLLFKKAKMAGMSISAIDAIVFGSMQNFLYQFLCLQCNIGTKNLFRPLLSFI